MKGRNGEERNKKGVKELGLGLEFGWVSVKKMKTKAFLHIHIYF